MWMSSILKMGVARASETSTRLRGVNTRTRLPAWSPRQNRLCHVVIYMANRFKATPGLITVVLISP
jgi:hypothetical protein